MKRLVALLALFAALFVALPASALPPVAHVLPGSFQPNWSSACVLWLRADLGITFVQGPVIATGTSPPAVTFTGSPASSKNSIVLTCTGAGTQTTATFSWTLNGIAQTPFTAAATVALTGTGITANFPVGSYTNTPSADTYTSVVTVSSWADQSGLGNTAAQATAAAQPNFLPTGWPNGKPTLQWTGTSGVYLGTGATVTLGAYSGFVVADTTVGGCLYGHGASTTNGGLSGGRTLGFGAGTGYLYVDGCRRISGTSYHFTNSNQNVTATGSHFTTETVVGQHLWSSTLLTSTPVINTISSDTAIILGSNWTGTTTTTATAGITDSTGTQLRAIVQPNSIAWQTDGNPHALFTQYNGTLASELLSVDGTDQAPYTTIVAGTPGVLTLTDELYVGNCGSGVTSQPTGLIGEVVLYKAAQAAATTMASAITQTRAYSQSFWGTP